MALELPFPELDEFLTAIGDAGQRLSAIDASEGAAGNISICIGWEIEVRRRFPVAETISLPVSVPALAGYTLLVTGSGRRLREISLDPTANLGAAVIASDGQSARLYTHPQRLFARLTSEFNSHLAVHQDQVQASGTNFHALIHAQPTYITYLSHIARYRAPQYLSRHLLRWQPELIVNLPEGVACLPFSVPGSEALMQATVASLRQHRVIVWSKHGLMARSDVSVKRASDRIEYVETAARYEYLNLVNGEMAEGLSEDEIRQICQALNIQQALF